jgi:hypothetical protein
MRNRMAPLAFLFGFIRFYSVSSLPPPFFGLETVWFWSGFRLEPRMTRIATDNRPAEAGTPYAGNRSDAFGCARVEQIRNLRYSRFQTCATSVTSCAFFYFHSLLFAFIRFWTSKSKIRITSKRSCIPEERKSRPPADRREGPFGLYGFYASHTGIYLSDAEQRREDFFM